MINLNNKTNGENDMENVTFARFITGKSLNKNSIAKYVGNDLIRLVHEYKQKPQKKVEFTFAEYEEFLNGIGDGVDTLAYMLDRFFDCEMLN